MAQANRAVGGTARRPFPNVSFLRLAGGFEDSGFNLIKLANVSGPTVRYFALPAFLGRVSPRAIAAIVVGLSRDGRPLSLDGAQRLPGSGEQFGT